MNPNYLEYSVFGGVPCSHDEFTDEQLLQMLEVRVDPDKSIRVQHYGETRRVETSPFGHAKRYGNYGAGMTGPEYRLAVADVRKRAKPLKLTPNELDLLLAFEQALELKIAPKDHQPCPRRRPRFLGRITSRAATIPPIPCPPRPPSGRKLGYVAGRT